MTSDDKPPSGLLTEDDSESPEFLVRVAADCVNDALALLDGMQTPAIEHLQRALPILIELAKVDPTRLVASQAFEEGCSYGDRPSLSPIAVELLAAHRMAGRR